MTKNFLLDGLSWLFSTLFAYLYVACLIIAVIVICCYYILKHTWNFISPIIIIWLLFYLLPQKGIYFYKLF